MKVVHKISLWAYNVGSDFTLGNSLFGAAKLTKKVDSDKYSYSQYGIGFDSRGFFSLSDCSWLGKNVIIFGVDNSSSAHADNRKKDILILNKGRTQGLDDATLTAKAE